MSASLLSLRAGVPLRDVQEAASHADPRTTMRYDRGRQSLDRHAAYIVATFVAGATASYYDDVIKTPAGWRVTNRVVTLRRRASPA
jgi:hypothetical protein